MIDRETKKVVAATDGDLTRAYTSHWVTQISFEEPIVMASVSPKHDTYPLMKDQGWFTVSLLAADQISEGQYFSYPGHKFNYVAPEYIESSEAGEPYVPNAIAWFRCEIFDRIERFDHDLFLANVVTVSEGRLKEPPLLYSARHGWRITGGNAREKGRSVRDELLARVAEQDQD